SYIFDEVCTPDTLAAGYRYVLHGFWWNVRHRRHSSGRRLRPRNTYLPAHANFVELSDYAHDWRTLERSATGRWLLCMGAPRDGKFLGLPGGVAFTCGVGLRYGHLSDIVCGLSGADVSVVLDQSPRRDRWTGHRQRERCSEYCGSQGGFGHLRVVVLSTHCAIRFGSGDCAIRARRVRACRCDAGRWEGGHTRRPACLHVELHGVGQRLDNCDRS